MATRWMKWDETTHIFMYSTDGVSFAPLPLNAACITEGTLNPAVIPAGGASLSGANTWTGQNMYSGIGPSIRFQETDAAANSKLWDIQADGATLNFKTLTDALAATTLLTLDRTGVLKLTPTGQAIHELTTSVAGQNVIKFTTLSPLDSTFGGLVFRSSAGDGRGYIIFTSPGNTNGAFATDGLSLYSSGGGGIQLYTGGAINLFSGSANRMSIAASGAITISSTINAVNGYLERNRSAPLGEWVAVPFNAADFTGSGSMTWTVAVGGFSKYYYMIVGKTMFVVFDVTGTLAGTANTTINIKIPGGATATIGALQPMWIQNGTPQFGTITQTGTILSITKDPTFSTNFIIGSARVYGMACFPIV